MENNHKETAGVVLPPPIVLLLALVAASALHWLRAWPIFQTGTLHVLPGAVLIAAAVLLAAWSMRTMRLAGTRYETSQPSSSIVSHGPFRITRNPIYVAMLMLLLGVGIAFNSGWAVLMMLPFFLVIRYGVIAREEAYLEGKFGADYSAYKRTVRRWL